MACFICMCIWTQLLDSELSSTTTAKTAAAAAAALATRGHEIGRQMALGGFEKR